MKAQWMSGLLAVLAMISGCQSPAFKFPFSRNATANASGPGQQAVQGSAQPSATVASPNGSFRQIPGQPLGVAPQVSNTWSGSQTGVQQLLSQGHAAFLQGDRMERENRSADASRLFAHAQSYYQRVLQQDPNNNVAHHRLAVIADKQNDFPSAEIHYLAAAKSDPGNANLLSDLGYSYLLQGRAIESERYLQDALRRNPTHPQAINNLGLLYARQGDLERALAMFRRTGTEAEAQAKLAQLVPQRTPSSGSNPAFATATMPGSSMSQTVPTSAQLPGNAVSALNAAPSTTTTRGLAGTPSEATLRLKAMMDRAKQQAVAARQETRPSVPSLPPSNRPASVWPTNQATVTSAQNPLHTAPNAYGSASMTQNAIPSRSGQPSQYIASAPMTMATPQPGSFGASGASANIQLTAPPSLQATPPQLGTASYPTRGANPSARAQPLDAMPTWPPPAQTTGYPESALDPSPLNVRSTPAPLSANQSSGSGSTTTTPLGSASAARPRASQSQVDPARQAAYLGMQAGPGQVFPIWSPRADTTNQEPRSGIGTGRAWSPNNAQTTELPRSVSPGTGSRLNGTQFAPPPSWRQPAVSQPSPMSGTVYGPNPSATPAANSTGPATGGVTPAGFQSAQGASQPLGPSQFQTRPYNGNVSRTPDPLAAYENQIRQHDAERWAMQQQLEAQRQGTPANVPQWPYTPNQSAGPMTPRSSTPNTATTGQYR